MSPFVYLAVGVVFALFAMLALAGALRTLVGGPKRAAARLIHQLNKETRRKQLAEINPATAYPLSAPMIKEVAGQGGYEFVDIYNRNGVEYLRFRIAKKAA